MRYALFFDAHIGAPGWERSLPYLHQAVQEERRQGAQIVWGGDTLDWYRDRQAEPPAGLIQAEDWWLPGNHDPEPYMGLPTFHYLLIDDVFVCHGDAVDLGWAFALLERLTRKRVRRESVFSLYRILSQGPAWAMGRLEAWFWRWLGHRSLPPDYGALLAFAPLLPALVLSQPARLLPPPGELTAGLGPLITHDPRLLVARLEALYPEARRARVLVMGHLHRPQKAEVGEKILLVSPSWKWGMPWGYVVVEKGRAEIRQIAPP